MALATNTVAEAILKVLKDHTPVACTDAGLKPIKHWTRGRETPDKSEMCPYATVYVDTWTQPITVPDRTIGGVSKARVNRVQTFAVLVTLAGEDTGKLETQAADYCDIFTGILEEHYTFDEAIVENSDVVEGGYADISPAEKKGWHMQSAGVRVQVTYRRTLGVIS